MKLKAIETNQSQRSGINRQWNRAQVREITCNQTEVHGVRRTERRWSPELAISSLLTHPANVIPQWQTNDRSPTPLWVGLVGQDPQQARRTILFGKGKLLGWTNDAELFLEIE